MTQKKKSEENKEEKVEEKSNDPEPATLDVAAIEEDMLSPKAISKKVAIERYLKKQGLGQNAIREVSAMFEELRKLKCKKHNQ